MNSNQPTWTNERRKLSELIPWERNPRQIKDKQAKRLIESFEDFGQVETIALSPDNEIYNGHQRASVLAGQHGMDYEVDVRVSSRPLTEKERERLTIFLHHSAAGEWDLAALAEWDTNDLLSWDFDLSVFDVDVAPNPDEGKDTEPLTDKAEELRVKWQVSTGQMWQLGEHRLICGDCTDRAVVERVMGRERASITFTSPPYNAGVSAQLSGNTSVVDNFYRDDYDDNQSEDDYLSLLNCFTRNAIACSDYVFVNIQVLAGNKRAFVRYWSEFVDEFADVAIWDKQHAAPQQAQRVMDSRFEFVLVFSHGATKAIGTRDFRGMVHNVYVGSPQRNNEFADVHAATFPVDFPAHFIGTFTNKNEIVYEPFSGSGTTLIACQNLSRKCRAIEISPAYVAVAIQRFYDHTGQEPVLIE